MGKKLTPKRAQEITILVWSYLRDHPEIPDKEHLPQRLYRLIENKDNECALCSLYGCESPMCLKCPLAGPNSCYRHDGPFQRWCDAKTPTESGKAAGEIVDIVSAWTPEEITK